MALLRCTILGLGYITIVFNFHIKLQLNTLSFLLRKLKRDAVPTLFHNCPSYMSSDPPNKRSKTSSASARRQQSAEDAEKMSQLFLEKDKVSSIHDIYQRIQSDPAIPSDITAILKGDTLFLCIIDIHVHAETPHLSIDLRIRDDLSYDSFVDGKKLNKNDDIVDGAELTLFSQVLNFIASLKSKVGRPDQPIFEDALIELKKSLQHDSFKSVDFLIEQLQLIRLPPNRRRYSKLSTVFAYLIWTAGSSAYRALLENEILILPSERTLRRITYKFGSPIQNTSVNYLKARRAGLTSSQSYINLMLDEIYTAKRFEYSSASGKVMDLTQAGEVASTILCFMASSVCDKYQDVVALILISHLNADKLKEATWNVLQLLAESGFNVVSLCCDNHTANRSFFKNVLCGGVLSSMV